MKTKALILGIAALSIPAIALAEGDGEKKGKGGDHRAKMLEKFDTDGDGKLDETEREAAKAAGKAHREELLSKYDANGDGKLDETEREAAKAAGEKIPPHGGKGKKGGKKGPRGGDE
ncbi:hypothetical protein ACFPK9_06195 [Rubritalea spongiae]|uniref:EF-hand domain-containing protein n=1 Tax=Rubritalea spongiae TaxID=430797 RepID=A0ABW5E5C9_9BACT